MNKIPNDISLKKLLSILHGIYHVQEYIDDLNNTHTIFFNNKDTNEGLFLLTRCIDRRYFIFSEYCNISLTISDTLLDDNNRPVSYVLSIDNSRSFASEELVKNILHHLTQDNFKIYYNINSENIYNRYISTERIKKIKSLKSKRRLNELE